MVRNNFFLSENQCVTKRISVKKIHRKLSDLTEQKCSWKKLFWQVRFLAYTVHNSPIRHSNRHHRESSTLSVCTALRQSKCGVPLFLLHIELCRCYVLLVVFNLKKNNNNCISNNASFSLFTVFIGTVVCVCALMYTQISYHCPFKQIKVTNGNNGTINTNACPVPPV